MIYEGHAFARAGLVGNPSDGYFGKTISIVIRNYRTTVRLWESPRLEILPNAADLAQYDSVAAMLRDVKLYGYYGGFRIIKAAIKKFYEYCRSTNLPLREGNFTISYGTNVPRLVGLSGSSAIVVATMRALMKFHGVDIPRNYLPTLVLSCERDELKITAGLQDRVIQVYEGMVYMDFDKQHLTEKGYGIYEELKPRAMPPLYVSFDANRAEVSDVTHRNLRELYDKGDATVVGAMQKYRDLTDRGRAAILAGDWDELHKVTDENYEIRRTIMQIAPENQRMIDMARSVGASAKFAGSGGAIVGVYHGGKQYQALSDAMASIGCTTLRPMVVEPA